MKAQSFIPAWIGEYKSSDFKPDLIAGLTVGVLLIPQGMAYALLAGLPAVYGLYASAVPLLVYAILGTSRHLSVGPVAIDSMLTAAGISLLAQSGTDDYILLAITLALIVGFIQFTLGIFRLGFLVKFLSHPVILGFTSAAAIIIGLSQLKHILGIKVVSSQHLPDVIQSVLTGISDTHVITLLIGIAGILFLVLMKKFFPSFPAPLFLVVLITIIVGSLRLDVLGVKVTGLIPAGLPKPAIPVIDFEILKKMIPTAFALALVSFMESMAVSRSLQAKHKTYKVNTNKELMAIGIANMTGSLFKSFPVSGGFSRSAVNEQAGARSGMSSVVTALLVLGTLLFLTPLFYYLPHVVLASIILVAVSRLINFREVMHLWHVDRKDFLMLLVTFIGTLFFGIGTGIGIGVLLSLAWIIFEASYPHHAELGRIPGTHVFRNIKRFKELVIENDILIFRFDAPLFFANVDRFRQLLLEYKTSRESKLKAIIVDMESINTIDTSAIHVLEDTIEEIKREGVQFLLAEVKGPVRDKFHRSGLTKKIGQENFFMTIGDALAFIGGKGKNTPPDIALQTDVRG